MVLAQRVPVYPYTLDEYSTQALPFTFHISTASVSCRAGDAWSSPCGRTLRTRSQQIPPLWFGQGRRQSPSRLFARRGSSALQALLLCSGFAPSLLQLRQTLGIADTQRTST
jgi:hypothetical protein